MSIEKWVAAKTGTKKPGKKAVAAANEASARARSSSANANSWKGNMPGAHAPTYISSSQGSKQVGQMFANHFHAANAHLEAADKQRAVGNEEKAKEHLAKASEHAKDSGVGKEGWDESKHPRDENGKFT